MAGSGYSFDHFPSSVLLAGEVKDWGTSSKAVARLRHPLKWRSNYSFSNKALLISCTPCRKKPTYLCTTDGGLAVLLGLWESFFHKWMKHRGRYVPDLLLLFREAKRKQFVLFLMSEVCALSQTVSECWSQVLDAKGFCGIEIVGGTAMHFLI